MRASTLLRAGGVLAVVVALATVPSWAARDDVHTFTFGLILALVALSLSLLAGWTKQISLAHAGFVGLGAWLTGTLTERGWPILLCLVVVALFAVPVGIAIALPALRLKGMFLAITTIAVMMMMQTVVFPHLVDPGAIVPLSALRPGSGLVDIRSVDDFYRFTAAVVGLFFAGAWLVSRSELHLRLRAASDEPIAFRSLGRNDRAYKLLAFVLSVGAAMVAGFLFALLNQQVSGEVFTIDQSIGYFSFAVIGGLGSIGGALVAGLMFGVLPKLVSDVFAIDRYLYLISGIGLVLLLIQAPGGLASVPRKVGHLLRSRRRAAATADVGDGTVRVEDPAFAAGVWAAVREAQVPGAEPGESAIRLDEVRVRFGGIDALTDVSLDAGPAEILAVLGPNGAGKTTLFNVLSGYQRPSSGTVHILGEDVTGRSVSSRARLGVARTFQTPKAFGRLTALENLLVAPIGGDSVLQLLRPPRPSQVAAATDLLELVGLAHHVHTRADRLPHVPARLLEVARAVATSPRVLLLDEPAAGMRPDESAVFGALLQELRAELGLTIVVIDHDLGWVMDLCDRAHILNFGQTIAVGTPEDVRRDAVVVEAYLGATMQHA